MMPLFTLVLISHIACLLDIINQQSLNMRLDLSLVIDAAESASHEDASTVSGLEFYCIPFGLIHMIREIAPVPNVHPKTSARGRG